MAADFLLSRILVSCRYDKVICLCLDRTKAELMSVWDENESKDRRACEEPKIVLSNIPFDGSAIIADLSEKIKCGTSENSSVGIIVYSLSEIVLMIGLAKAISFAKQLTTLIGGAATTNPQSKTTVAIIFVVHESLHNTQALFQLQTLAGVTVRIVPNRGTLSPEVAAEIQSVRKSPATGKVSEAVEMFAFRDGRLHPLLGAKTVDAADSSSEKDPTAINSLAQLLDTAEISASGAITPRVTPVTAAAPPPSRLIAFDSTDPEFDEDSDPDADLDL